MRVILISTFALILSGVCSANRINLLHLNPRQYGLNDVIPVYNSINDFTKSLGTRRQNDFNFLLLKPAEEELSKPQELRNLEPLDSSVGNGRTFKHLLFLKSLMSKDSSSGGGGGTGNFIYPIIVSTPLNITNVNNNTVTNAPAAADGGAAGAGDVRIKYIGVPQFSSYPYQMPIQNMQMPTEVYHQRQVGQIASPNALSTLNGQGNVVFMPIAFPQLMAKEYSMQRKRDNDLIWSNGNIKKSPLMAFANNFRGIQLL